ncbi:unnamed protein product [Miscanthus lutarioriparius]|uniref:Retrovirus-related Pol polyprotein from transposon TNT 1-94-like beta-barrel domain-containing protein n=1 Tax=Miscanthus lutarioriparius TaxID=422564 RepID=A0A811PZC0_9POAL|nr:unnamed protein product [Miscanthus lutarioriparius]
MQMKMKLFTLKMKEDDSVMSHIAEFKKIVADLVSMEVKYDDEDLGLLLLCSLPNSYANFRDTILLSRDELTLKEVYEALQSREKMRGMVQNDGTSSSKGDALHVRGRTENRSSNDGNDGRKNYERRGRSKSKPHGNKKFCVYCKLTNHNVEDCRKVQNKEKRKNKSAGKVSVAAAASDDDSGDCLVVFAGCVAGHDEWILDSACSFHICTNRNWFISYKPVQKGDVVWMGDDNPCDIVGIGSVQIKTDDGMTRTLKNVRSEGIVRHHTIPHTPQQNDHVPEKELQQMRMQWSMLMMIQRCAGGAVDEHGDHDNDVLEDDAHDDVQTNSSYFAIRGRFTYCST